MADFDGSKAAQQQNTFSSPISPPSAMKLYTLQLH
jgi:hypothetical protein